VKVLLPLVLLLTFPLQLFPVSETLDQLYPHGSATIKGFRLKPVSNPTGIEKRKIVRSALVTSTVLVAMGLPFFGNVLSLLGAIAYSLIGYQPSISISYERIHLTRSVPVENLWPGTATLRKDCWGVLRALWFICTDNWNYSQHC
jgi:hypothetical protein